MTTFAEQWKAEGFNLGMLKGKAEGEARGKAAGKIEGKAEGKAEMLLRQLCRRFKALPGDIESRVQSADSDQLDEWSERILDAQTLTDVFEDGSEH